MSIIESARITVIKRNPAREETWRYNGIVLQRTPSRILIEAHFNRPDLPFHGIVLRQGDRFLEQYFCDRWYNIFEVHDRQDDRLKCWYCNVTLPAEFLTGEISYVDLALDLLVFPNGTQLVLDEEEFRDLNLDAETSRGAWEALEELRVLFSPPRPFSYLSKMEKNGGTGEGSPGDQEYWT